MENMRRVFAELEVAMEERPPFEKGQILVLADPLRYRELSGRTLKVAQMTHNKLGWWVAFEGNALCSYDAEAFRCG